MERHGFDLIDEWGPEKIVQVRDRRSGMVGVLVIDNTARGIGKGGTRMRPDLTVSEVARLARMMTWKWAAVDLFHGGAKAGILGDPNGPGKERVLRAFARALRNEVPSEYLYGLDMGLTESDAAVFADELGDLGVTTGLPRALGGLPYDELGVTGYGVAEAADTAVAYLDRELAACRVSVHGFGAVGQAAARRLSELGASIVAVATASGTLHDPDGLDVPRMLREVAEHGEDFVTHRGSTLPAAAALRVPAEILVPAAREDTIDASVAPRIQAQLIVEGANLPTSVEARQQLSQRGVLVVPDFIANAGGIVAAAHSTALRNSPFPVEPVDVFTMISEKLRANTVAVIERSQRMGVGTHYAALDLVQCRVSDAMRLRRQFPEGERS